MLAGAAMTGQPPHSVLPLAAYPTQTTATVKSPPPSSGTLLKAVGKVGEHLPALQPCLQPPNTLPCPSNTAEVLHAAQVLWPGRARGPCSAFCHDRSRRKAAGC